MPSSLEADWLEEIWSLLSGKAWTNSLHNLSSLASRDYPASKRKY